MRHCQRILYYFFENNIFSKKLNVAIKKLSEIENPDGLPCLIETNIGGDGNLPLTDQIRGR